MAVGMRDEMKQATRYNVKNGQLVNHQTGEVADWISGVIRGIRTYKDQKFKHLKLEVKIEDPSDSQEGIYIISGGLTNPDNTIQTWARHLLTALGNPANGIGRGDRIRIIFWPFETNFGVASCCALQFESEPINLPQLEIAKNDLKQIAAVIDQVAEQWSWGQTAALPASSQTKQIEEKKESVEEAEIVEERPVKQEKEVRMPNGAAEAFGATPASAPKKKTEPELDPNFEDDDLPF